MKISKKKLKIIRWTIKIFSLVILLFALPFYFGYGNPLPFANPDNTVFDNAWLFAFPLIFVGLALGWKYEKMGGYLIIIPILLASIIGSIFSEEIGIPGPMYFPLVAGILYLIIGYKK